MVKHKKAIVYLGLKVFFYLKLGKVIETKVEGACDTGGVYVYVLGELHRSDF